MTICHLEAELEEQRHPVAPVVVTSTSENLAATSLLDDINRASECLRDLSSPVTGYLFYLWCP